MATSTRSPQTAAHRFRQFLPAIAYDRHFLAQIAELQTPQMVLLVQRRKSVLDART